jgi:UDP-N-acetylmuramoyl-L-alanyl-D-glutamate--2,6-diaminopimelate ligase
MHAAGTTHVAMEVSSHALVQERVAGCRFDAAVFTNLTRDHLDFHGDLEAYYQAKARLFRDHLRSGGKRDPVAVVNVDDAAGARLADEVAVRCVRVGRERADVRPRDVASTLEGTRGELVFGGTRVAFECPLVGAPHLENVLCAAGAAWALGVPADPIARGLAGVVPPPGRLEQIVGPGFTVIVDYAHTPDALARALDVLRALTRGRLITVFGCGGDRDRGKRPVMGRIAAELADLAIVTSDNPRSEEPDAIIAEIVAGAGDDVEVEPDRALAIAHALEAAVAGDVVVIAGKGHEQGQEFRNGEKIPFDDREVARDALRRLGAKA